MLTCSSISGYAPRIDPTAPDTPSLRRLPSLLAAIGLVLAFVAVQAVMFGVLGSLGGTVSVDDALDAPAALLLGAIQVAGIVAALGFVALGVANPRQVGLRATSAQARAGLAALLVAGGFVVVPSIAGSVWSGDGLVAAGVSPLDAVTFVALAVLIAINEELWFRGLVVHVLGARARPWWTITIAALLFGLPHYTGDMASLLNAAAVTLAVGVPFAVVRLRYRALLPLMFWHAVIDAWAFLHTSSVVAEGSPTTAELLVALVVPALLALGYVAWYRSSRAA